MRKRCTRCGVQVYPEPKGGHPHFSWKLHFCVRPWANRLSGTCPWCGKQVTLQNGYTVGHRPDPSLYQTMGLKSYRRMFKFCQQGKALPKELAPVLFAIADLSSADEN